MTFKLPPPRLRKWTLLSTREAARFPVFGVVGRELSEATREIFTFECSEWTNVIALTDNDEIVMAWQYRFGTDALSLEIPGGVVDDGEDPASAARRELLEETGYEAGELELLVTLEANPALQNNRVHTYVARGVKKVADPRFDENEELEVVLVPRKHLAEIMDQGHVTHALVWGVLETFLRRHPALKS